MSEFDGSYSIPLSGPADPPAVEILTALFELVPDAVLITDVSGRIVLANPKSEEMFGYRRSDLQGRTVELLLPTRFRESHVAHRRRYCAEPRARPMGSDLGLVALRKDGREFSVDVQLAPLSTRQGLLISAFVHDVTDRKRAESDLDDRLRQQAAVARLGVLALAEAQLDELMTVAVEFVAHTLRVEYSKVLESLPDGTFGLRAGVGWKPGLVGNSTVEGGEDSQAGFTLVSKHPVIVEDLGIESRFSGPKLLRDHGVRSGLSVAILGRKRTFGVLGAHTRDQRLFTEDDVHFLQSVANLLATAIDRRQGEEKRKDLEEQLRLSQKMQAVGQLAGGVAHDFNNLLTAILGHSELVLARLGEEDPSSQAVMEIRKAGLRAASLTRQLLAFSRRQVLRPEVLDVNHVVTETEAMLRPLLAASIRLVKSLAPSVGRVRADPGQLEQVLLNLALNARDAMPTGGSLLIETANFDLDEADTQRHLAFAPGAYVLMSVSDTGCGMDAETRTRIFEPFFTTKDQGKGTGLGLATVYGIVKQSGGYIWVYSEPGQGTTFKVYLPRIEAKLRKARTRDSAAGVLQGSETVLVAEDDDAVRELVCENLSEHGYEVLSAPDGCQALEVARRHPGTIHLLLTDVVMPRMDGNRLAERLGDSRPETKVLFMSGYAESVVVESGLLDSWDALLQKPFTSQTLLRKVRGILDSTDRREGLADARPAPR